MGDPYQHKSPLLELKVDEVSKIHLRYTVRWIIFLFIMVMIISALSLLSIAIKADELAKKNETEFYTLLPGFAGNILGLLISVFLYSYPVYGMLRFSLDVNAAIKNNDQQRFNKGLAYLKGVLKYMGIFMFVWVIISVVVFAVILA